MWISYDNLLLWLGLSIFFWMLWPVIVYSRWRMSSNNILITIVISLAAFPLTVIMILIILLYYLIASIHYIYYFYERKY